MALEVLEAAVGLLGFLPLLLDLGAQPLPRLGRGLEAQVQALLDVELGEGVRCGGGELGRPEMMLTLTRRLLRTG